MDHVNAANAYIFGSDNDSLYLGPYDPQLREKITGLYTALPTGLVDCGWMSDDGIKLTLDDSVSKIKGHQGHRVVKTFMDSSETSTTATLLETKVDTVKHYLDAKVERVMEAVGAEQKPVARLTVPTSRRVLQLSGVVELFDTSGSDVKIRMVLEHIELGERGEISFVTGSITAYEHTLNLLDDFDIWTDAPALIPAA